jgi:hypothetical protein
MAGMTSFSNSYPEAQTLEVNGQGIPWDGFPAKMRQG